jgi:L-lactate dehydrogenase complex protein LldG
MSSRENILNAIKENKPASNLELPAIASYTSNINPAESLPLFIKNLTDNAALVKMIESSDQIPDLILHQWNEYNHIHAPMIPYLHNTPATPEAVVALDIAVVKGYIGVINNGAIWIHDQSLEHRSVAFLTKYLVILLDQKDLVFNLHEAYARINPFDLGYGVWISGPSKTGDIEQALVIGAHGPLEVMVLIQSHNEQ